MISGASSPPGTASFIIVAGATVEAEAATAVDVVLVARIHVVLVVIVVLIQCSYC